MREARRLLRLHADMAELIRLGAYRAGSDAELDCAIAVQPALERLLEQDAGERSTSEAAFAGLAAALAQADPADLMRRAVDLLARLERHALDEQRLALTAHAGRAGAAAREHDCDLDRRLATRARDGIRVAGRPAAAGGLRSRSPKHGAEPLRAAETRLEQEAAAAEARLGERVRSWKGLDLVASELRRRDADVAPTPCGRAGRRGGGSAGRGSELGCQRDLEPVQRRAELDLAGEPRIVADLERLVEHHALVGAGRLELGQPVSST